MGSNRTRNAALSSIGPFCFSSKFLKTKQIVRMARIARLVVPGYPHHITQRGNRKQRTFFCEADYRRYLELIGEAAVNAELDIWAYCLMPNHVHFVIAPKHPDSLVRLFKEAHRRYTREINRRNEWQGHLWQERFHSTVMDEPHLLAAVRYVELNPVIAGLCSRPEDWQWSSARAHMRVTDDKLLTNPPILKMISNWTAYLNSPLGEERITAIKKHSSSGQPLGDEKFVARLEGVTGRRFAPRKIGARSQLSTG